MARDDHANRGAVVWLTGLPGSGKSTLAEGAHRQLTTLGLSSAVIDGDVLRHTVCRDLGYSDEDRRENIRRAGEAAIARAETGLLALVALISPFDDARCAVRDRCAGLRIPFAMVYICAPLAVCERRDPKGLYRLARQGAIPHFTGVSSPYQEPSDPTLVVRTDEEPERDSIERVVDLAMRLLGRDPLFYAGL